MNEKRLQTRALPRAGQILPSARYYYRHPNRRQCCDYTMSGVAVIRSLLATNAAVLAVVPSSRIISGDLPVNTVMPAIAITQISSVPRLTLRMSELPRMHTDRVQVSVLFKGPSGTPVGTGYPGVKALLILVLAACPNQRGTVNGISVDSILPDIEGPDLQDDATALYSGSRDFIVKWISAT